MPEVAGPDLRDRIFHGNKRVETPVSPPFALAHWVWGSRGSQHRGKSSTLPSAPWHARGWAFDMIARLLHWSRWGGLLSALLLGCSAPIVRVREPALPEGPPSIEALVDLGAYAPRVGDELDQSREDGHFSVGEWVLVRGKHLSSVETQVQIDDTPISVSGHLSDGSILVRIPSGISVRRSHRLRVRTRHGSSEHAIVLSAWIVVGDIGGDQLRFLRASSYPEELWEDEAPAIDVDDLGPVALSADRAFAYAVARKPLDSGARYAWLRVHLGAEAGPAVDQRGHFELESVATDLALGLDGSVFVLTARGLHVFTGEQRPGRVLVGPTPPLPESQWSLGSLVLFNGERNAAALEVFSNQILVFAIHDRSKPELLGTYRFDEATHPVGVGLVASPSRHDELWLLRGPNQRTLGVSLKRALDVRGWLAPNNPAPTPDWGELVASVKRFAWSGQSLQPLGDSRLPPGFVPISLARSPRGLPWVTGVSSSWFHVADASAPTLSDYAHAFFKSADVGYLVELGEDGSLSTTTSGMMIAFNPTYLSGEALPLYSAVRIGPRFFPPSVGLNWVVEAAEIQSERVRALDFTSWMPPYQGPRVLVQ